MKAIVLCLILAIAAVSASSFTEAEYQYTFTQWMRSHGKHYAAADFQKRYTSFKFNMDYVHNWNAQGSDTILGLNSLADLSNAEYQSIYLGTRINVPNSLLPVEEPQVRDNYNTTVDWRTKDAVTPIKDQGECGSCWAFSTVGSTEGAHALKTGKLVSLSEQNLVDCSSAQGNQGCNGGLMDQGFQYIITNKGIDTEASYPYKAKDGKCKFDAANVGATLSSYKDVKSKSEAALETAVNQQPVSVAIDASHNSFQLYAKGIYYEKSCSETSLDHGVLAVGYGVDTTSNDAYWIVKNSWGTDWGMDGWIYMTKDKNNNCGIATQASYPIA